MSASAPSDWPEFMLFNSGRDDKLGVFSSSTFAVFEVEGVDFGSSTCFATYRRLVLE